ncbi:hypothetical protein BREVUG8_100520 [Brevundimonas sp. G8]|nr:hypothetical protein BREVUG8_100520 [Brevundimonas sp. G8]
MAFGFSVLFDVLTQRSGLVIRVAPDPFLISTLIALIGFMRLVQFPLWHGSHLHRMAMTVN